MKKRFLIGVGLFIMVGLGCLFTIQMWTLPSGETRIVLDLSNETYISPPCFELEERGNNIAEVSLNKAKKFNFKPDSICTEQSLQGVKQRLINVLLIRIGLIEDRWSW